MPSYLDHLITDPLAPATAAWARQVEEVKRTTPARVRAARRAELATSATRTPAPRKAAPPPVVKGAVSADLTAWWQGANDGTSSVTAVIRLAARTFPDMGRGEFITTLASLGVNPSTAGVQFKKGRDQ